MLRKTLSRREEIAREFQERVMMASGSELEMVVLGIVWIIVTDAVFAVALDALGL